MQVERRKVKANVNAAVSQRGVALVLVLWIITVLMVIAASFTITGRTDAFSALASRSGIENKYLAEAGLQRGIMEIIYRSVNKNQTVTLPGRELVKTDGRPYAGSLGKGSYTFRIMDESAKININGLSDTSGIFMKNLLVNAGVAASQADVIVDSILDWKDPDNLHRLNGAESDYYLSLPQPYRSKDAEFDTLEELLLVKGMTPEILYGRDGKPGIIRFLSISPDAGFMINVNVASREVLMAIPGMTASIADLVVSARDSDDPAAAQAALEAVRSGLGQGFALVSPYVGAGDSSTFCIEAEGSRDSRRGYSIRAVVTFNANNSYQYVYYKSPSDGGGQ